MKVELLIPFIGLDAVTAKKSTTFIVHAVAWQ